MSTLRHLILSLTIFFYAQSALACEPCLSKSPLERTVAQSSVIALVQNNDQDSSSDLQYGPELVELTIERVLKGEVDTYAVLVHSWYGACAYGVHMKLRERAVVLLQEMTDIRTGTFDGTYKLVEDGCSEGQLEVRGNTIWVNNKWMPISYFESQYLSNW